MEGKRVIGIDPASGKASFVFAPADRICETLDRHDLREYIKSLSGADCLVCWDAPLTAGTELAMSVGNGSLTQRLIERRFASKVKDVPGVSVRGFAMLSHWTISQFVLGLPVVGDYCTDVRPLPLTLGTCRRALEEASSVVTEVHPTLAAWYWLKSGTRSQQSQWAQYKGKIDGKSVPKEEVSRRVRRMWTVLLSRLEMNDPYEHHGQSGDKMSGDEFDARVSWLLGRLWIDSDRVKLFGSLDHGTFLLPKEAMDDVPVDLHVSD